MNNKILGIFVGLLLIATVVPAASSETNWTEKQKFFASDGAASDYFSESVALDGDTAIIGATYAAENGP